MENPSPTFWNLIHSAGRDRSQMRSLLQEMTRDEIISFHQQFLDAATALLTPRHYTYMSPETSEDGADDISRWVVGQGADYYYDIFDHPEKFPKDVAPHSNEQVYYEIARVFIARFDEDIWKNVD